MRIRHLSTILLISLSIAFLGACKKEEAPKVKVPAKVVLDPAKTERLANQRLISEQVDVSPLPTESDYIRILAQPKNSSAIANGFLSAMTSDDTKSIVLIAHIENGPSFKLPAVPLFIFEKEASNWKTTFSVQNSLSPFFVAKRAPLSVSLELVLLKDKLKGLEQDAAALVEAYATRLTLYSNEGAHKISTLADEFSQRIGLVEEASLRDVAQFTISYLENYGANLKLTSSGGSSVLETLLYVEGRESFLPLYQGLPQSYSTLLAQKISDLSPRDALADLEKSFWSVPPEALLPNCQAIQGALQERLGLSKKDSALIIWRMMQPHALFARETDYISQCSGENIAVLLQEAGLNVPPQNKVRPPAKTTQLMNRTLSQIARFLKNPRDENEQKISQLIGENIVLRDQARLLFSADPKQIISTEKDVVAPTLENKAAAQYLMMLPVKSFGCYSRGLGQVGNHRASLLTLENDPHLWLMDFAFDEKNKINGMQLRRSNQYDFCRSIGGRSGNNRCVFSGKSFPGLTAAKCAR